MGTGFSPREGRERCPGTGAARWERCRGWRREWYPGTGTLPGDRSGTRGQAHCPGTGAVRGDRSGARGGRTAGCGTVGGSGTQRWSVTQSWRRRRVSRTLCSPSPRPRGCWGGDGCPAPWWVLPTKPPPHPQALQDPGEANAPWPGPQGRDGSSSERAAARRWRMPCAPEGTSPAPDPHAASSKEPPPPARVTLAAQA